MKFLSEDIKVLYFASNCVEPYVEVKLLDRQIHRWIDRFLQLLTNFVVLPSPDYLSP